MLGWAAALVAVVVGVRLLWLLPAPGSPSGCTPGGTRRGDPHWLAGDRRHVVGRDARAWPPWRWRWPSRWRRTAGEPFPDRDEIVFIAFGVIMATLVLQGLTLPWLVSGWGCGRTPSAEMEIERSLAIRAAKAAKRRLQGDRGAWRTCRRICPEQLLRRAYDIGARISPDMVDEERREAYASGRAVKRMRRIQRGDDVARPGTRCWRRAASRGPTPRSWTGCCGIWTSAACGDMAATIV